MTELKIYKNLFQRFEKKVIISALHRLHLLPLFDYIYVMEKGGIVAEGQFQELMDNSAEFQELYKHQEELLK